MSKDIVCKIKIDGNANNNSLGLVVKDNDKYFWINVDNSTENWCLYKNNKWYWVRDDKGNIIHHPKLYELRKEFLQPYLDKLNGTNLSDYHAKDYKINVVALLMASGKSTLALKMLVNGIMDDEPSKGWIYSAREIDTLEIFKFDLIALSDRRMSNKICIIHSGETSDREEFDLSVKFFGNINTDNLTIDVETAVSKEPMTDEELVKFKNSYYEGGSIPIHYRPILLITHASLLETPINYWNNFHTHVISDAVKSNQRQVLIIDEFNPLLNKFDVETDKLDRYFDSLMVNQPSGLRETRVDRISNKQVEVFNPHFSVKKLNNKEQSFNSTQDIINAFNNIVSTIKEDMSTVENRLISRILMGDKAKYKLLGNNKQISNALINSRVDYYFNGVLLNAMSNSLQFNKTKELGVKIEHPFKAKYYLSFLNTWKFEQTYILDGTGDIIFTNEKDFSIHKDDRQRYCNIHFIKPLKGVEKVKSKITGSKNSLNKYLNFVTDESKKILQKSENLLVVTTSRDTDNIIKYEHTYDEASGTNITEEIKKRLLKEFDDTYQFDVIGHNSSQAIGSNNYADFTNIFIASKYYNNQEAINIFNKLNKCKTTKTNWNTRSNLQSIGRIGRNGQKINIYLLGNKGDYIETLDIIDVHKLTTLQKQHWDSFLVLKQHYPDIIDNKNLVLKLDEIFNILPRSEKKKKKYYALIKSLKNIGITLEIK